MREENYLKEPRGDSPFFGTNRRVVFQGREEAVEALSDTERGKEYKPRVALFRAVKTRRAKPAREIFPCWKNRFAIHRWIDASNALSSFSNIIRKFVFTSQQFTIVN